MIFIVVVFTTTKIFIEKSTIEFMSKISEKVDINYQLFTPGPVHTPNFILEEMGKYNDTHRGPIYQKMHVSIRENMQKLLNTKNEILIFASTGSGIMEASVRNLLLDDDEALFFTCGAFGDRWAKNAKACGKKADVVSVEYGEAITPALVEENINKKDYKAVFITYNETSTGVTNPIAEISKVLKEKAPDALFCIDAVSAMAGIPINVDEWGIDVALASVQKAFAVSPGIAVCSISERALKKTEIVPNRGMYLDFIQYQKRGLKNECPVTIAIPQVRSLAVVLEKMVEKGIDKHLAEQVQRTQMIQKWATDNGFEIFGPKAYQSNTVVTIRNNKDIDAGAFVKKLMEKGYRIVNGYGAKLKNKTFRIAAMGWYTMEETQKMLDAATEALSEI